MPQPEQENSDSLPKEYKSYFIIFGLVSVILLFMVIAYFFTNIDEDSGLKVSLLFFWSAAINTGLLFFGCCGFFVLFLVMAAFSDGSKTEDLNFEDAEVGRRLEKSGQQPFPPSEMSSSYKKWSETEELIRKQVQEELAINEEIE